MLIKMITQGHCLTARVDDSVNENPGVVCTSNYLYKVNISLTVKMCYGVFLGSSLGMKCCEVL